MRASCFVTEGCLISIFRHETGSGGRGMTHVRRCDCAARRLKPQTSRRASRAPLGPRDGGTEATGHRSNGPNLGLKRWLSGLAIRKESVGCLKGKTTGGDAEQTSKHRARDALGLADLRHYRFRQASIPRGVEARGSEHSCLRTLRKLGAPGTLGVPRALGSIRASGKGIRAYPALAQRIRAMMLA